MEPIAVIFPLAKGTDTVVDPAFAREYEACEALEDFEVVLCNTEDCIAGDTLVIDRTADRKTTYSLLRTPPTWRTTYDRVERALKHKGFKLVVNWSGHRQY